MLTPSFNQGRRLKDNLASVATQTYAHIEHIVVDGGSNDDSVAHLKASESNVRWVSEREGDDVLVPANTFVATLEAVTKAGGRPVLVDVSERDLNIDPAAAGAASGPRTRFVLPVHLYGQLAGPTA